MLANPTEDKYRKLRSSNNKIAALLATRGVRALLRGAGFLEEGEFLVLSLDTPNDGVQAALSDLEALAVAREQEAEAAKQAAIQQRKALHEVQDEKRKVMRMQVSCGGGHMCVGARAVTTPPPPYPPTPHLHLLPPSPPAS